MGKLKSRVFLVIGLFLVGVSGCAYPISKEWRAQARKDLAFSTVLQDPTPHIGSIVIWGGLIITTENEQTGADITVLETPLDYTGMPGAAESSQGRFIARSSTFLDPAIYAPGRKITVAGEIAGKDTRPIDRRDYAYPVVEIRQGYLWPRYIYRHYDRPYDYWDTWGWWGSFGPFIEARRAPVMKRAPREHGK